MTNFHTILLLLIILLLSACTVTPTEETVVADDEVVETMKTVEVTETVEVIEVDIETEKLPTPPLDNNAELLASAPEQYIVKKGDTLWDISSKFLQNHGIGQKSGI